MASASLVTTITPDTSGSMAATTCSTSVLPPRLKQRLGRAHFANARPHSATGATRQHDARDVVVARHRYAPLRAGVQVTIAVRLGDTPLTV